MTDGKGVSDPTINHLVSWADELQASLSQVMKNISKLKMSIANYSKRIEFLDNISLQFEDAQLRNEFVTQINEWETERELLEADYRRIKTLLTLLKEAIAKNKAIARPHAVNSSALLSD